jgi:phosphate transport system substrate-binding protein
MKPLIQFACWWLIAVSAAAAARDSGAPQPYQPREPVAGVVRVWTHPHMQDTMRRWQAGFLRHHPQARIVANFPGSDVAVAGLYTKAADVALLGREITASETQAFEWIFRYRPTRVEVMTGSLATPGKSAALGLFVHKDNPLATLTLAQADAIFGHERLRGLPAITIWGQLGVEGKWKDRPIRLYGYDAWSGSGRFFRHMVLNDSRNMNWDRLREFKARPGRDGKVQDAGRRIHAALAADRFGMAVATLSSAPAGTVPLALAAEAGGAFVAATKETLVARRYPLARSAVALVHRAPGKAIDPNVAEFLRYILSREGQADVAADAGYLPLAAANVDAQLKHLE